MGEHEIDADAMALFLLRALVEKVTDRNSGLVEDVVVEEEVGAYVDSMVMTVARYSDRNEVCGFLSAEELDNVHKIEQNSSLGVEHLS